MPYELIISEKPSAAQKIAFALADYKPIKESISGVPYYKISHNKKDIIVACAVGHLYTLEEKDKGKWTYPTFDIEWVPNEKAEYSKKYLQAIKNLAKGANEFTVACDYDIEGEVIGLNIIRFACNQKDAKRMKFSTLTKPDLEKAYANASKHLDWGQANAGETRHYLDYYYGINLSRALTLAIRNAVNKRKTMSIGRVQGPALKIIVEKEKEIMAFKPTPYWEIQLNGIINKAPIIAMHIKGRFDKKEEAERILEKTKGKNGIIAEISQKQSNIQPPHPFDLTTLQTEAYRCFKINPKETLAIAQELYVNGWISYPRTSSQQLPYEIGFKRIIGELAKQKNYTNLANSIIGKMPLRPNNGKKTDPAHPAIYPTGIIPKIDGKKEKIYDLIVKRFLATFADPAVRETISLKIDVNNEIFITSGTRTIDKGWFEFYFPYVPYQEEELPKTNKGDKVDVKKITILNKTTQPPKRYTPASIITELEKRNLGTKATRAQIIDTLMQRNYITGESIQATILGIRTAETLEKYSPEILDEELTRKFEEEMEQIRENLKKPSDVLAEARDVLIKILSNFKKREIEIGKELYSAEEETQRKINYLGKCVCGGDLQIKKSKFGRFISCTNYPKCEISFPLPKLGKIIPTDEICKYCKNPIIKIGSGKKAQTLCINNKCQSKNLDKEQQKIIQRHESGKIEKNCPKCGSPLVVRNSIYGNFYGCSTYPKCKYTENINGKKEEKDK